MSESIAPKTDAPQTDGSRVTPTNGLAAPSLPPESSGPVAPPGYEILFEVGHGGMGVVYHARELAFNRSVALKYLKPEYAGDPGASKRFLYEAQITARLQHPGIPPVHQVGTLPDGRPFLAMKLIQGLTLDHLLREQGPGAARWLAVFEAICQAVGYAHSQNIIHRDLKPGNVMVGAFGEVQVMDWGLAKVLTTAPVAVTVDENDPDSTTPPVPGMTPWLAGLDQTRAGSVLGTPAYMPPEQAIGAVDRLDRRSDVFGLGAILCALLTGKPPFVGNDGESTRQLAARAKLDDAFARLDACDAEPGLIALAKRCLATEQDERPADGGQLAAAVAELRREAEERARQAELDRVREAVQAEERARQAQMEVAHAQTQAAEQQKRRRMMALGGGAVMVVLLAGIVGTTFGLIQADRARRDEQWHRGQAEIAQAKEEKARGMAEEKRKDAEKARDLARQRYTLALDAFNQMVFGIQYKLETRPGTQDLRKDLLENARKGLRKLLKEAERQGSTDSTLVWAHLRVGDVELLLGRTEAARAEYQAGHDLAARLAGDDPRDAEAQRDLSVSYERVGDVALRLGQTKEAMEHYQRCLDVRLRLAKDDPRNGHAQRGLSVSYNKLGDVALRLGQTKEALDLHQKSLDVRLKLAQDAPKDAQAQRDLSVSYNKLGDVALRLERAKEALEHYRKGLDVSLKLAKDDPRDAEAQRDLSISYERLGDVALRMGKTKEALEHYRKGLDVHLRLAKDDPSNAEAQTDLFISYWKLGSAEKGQHQYSKAGEWFTRGRAVLLPLHEKNLLVGEEADYFADVDREIALCKAAEQAIADIDFVFTQKPEAIGGLLMLRVRALLHRQKPAEAASTAKRLADWAEKQDKIHDDHRYDAACALALCAAASDGKEKDAMTDRVVAVLTKLREAGYFQDAERLAHFHMDTDFAGLRKHPAFVKFAKTLKK